MRPILPLMLLLSAGCMSFGKQVTPNQLAAFQKGATTEAAVIAQLGPPSNSTTMDDGSKMDMYYYMGTRLNAASFVPFVGALAGGATSTTNSANLTFDRNGVLASVTSSVGQSNVNTGLLNQ